MLETIPISKFKATCLRLLGDVKKTGKSILVRRKGEPIALVTPPPPPPKRIDGWVAWRKRLKLPAILYLPFSMRRNGRL